MKSHLLTLLVSLLFHPLCAQFHGSGPLLSLRSGTFVLPPDKDGGLSHGEVERWESFEGYYFGLVRLSRLPSTAIMNQLSTEGIHILEYIPDRTYVVAIGTDANPGHLGTFGIEAQGPFLPAYKWLLDPDKVPSIARTGKNTVLVNIHPFGITGLDKVTAALEKHGFDIVQIRETYGFATVECSVQQLAQLAELPFVQFMDWHYDYGMPENYTGRTAHRTNFISADNSNGISYSGEGINVLLQDDGIIGPHIDHRGRVVEQFWATSEGDHGDHVGGTIAGAGNLNPYHGGQAGGANLYVYKAAPEYQGFDSIVSHYNSRNIVITSTSYSNGCNAGYTALTRTMDDQVQDMLSLMHVFSAGNSGTSNCGYGAGSFWGNITGGHKMGKNVITVANLDENDLVAQSSSRGPATDGRIKPDISAKGTSVSSTIANNQYDTYSGTSMACPGVSGTLAVLYEAFEDLYGILPESGLMKGFVLNTADDIGNPGPDFIHGWGRINARKAYEALASGSFITNAVGNGDSIEFNINVPSGLASARFMIYWTDPEASIGASTALVNDLDLSVTDPAAVQHLRWVLDPTPNETLLNLPAAPGEDHLNNVEQVEITSPAAGNYTVKVKGYQLALGPQLFHLVYWFEPETLTLTYPVGGESLVPFTTEKIRWDTPFTGGNLSIEYSTDGGNTWATVTNAVPVDQSYYDWTVPPVATGNVVLRLTYGSTIVTSQVFSVIATPTNLTVVYSCPDSIGLSWSAAPGATGYTVHKLGAKYMDAIGTATTTEYVDYLSNPMSDVLWYSVSSKGPDNALGKRAIALKKQPGIFNCIIPMDAHAVSIDPPSGALLACHGEQVPVSFVLRNTGNSVITSFDAILYLQGNLVLQESFPTALAPLAEDSFEFSTTLSLPASPAEYTLVIDLPNDGNPYNDTLTVEYTPGHQAAIAPLWNEDFETFELCSTTANCSITVCELNNGWINLSNNHADNTDWRTNAGETPSGSTGPDTDHTLGTVDGKYLYIEASGECTFKTAHLISPCLDLQDAVNPSLVFWYHMQGIEQGELHLDAFDGNDWHLDIMPPLSGNISTQWQMREVLLTEFAGKTINLRFRGITGSGYRSDIAIDDIQLIHPPIANFSYGVQTDGYTVAFTDLSLYGDSMVFDPGDGSMPLNDIPATYTYGQITPYLATQIVTNAAGADTAVQIIHTLGQEESAAGGMNRIYPNPATTALFLTTPDPSRIQRIALYSSDGRLVRHYAPSTAVTHILDVHDVRPGVYHLRLNDEINLPVVILR